MAIDAWVSSKDFSKVWKAAFLDKQFSHKTNEQAEAPRAYEKAGSYWLELREHFPGVRLITMELRKDLQPITLSLRCWFYEQAAEQYQKLVTAGKLELLGKYAARYLDQRPHSSWQAKLDLEGVRAVGIRYSLNVEDRLNPDSSPAHILRAVASDFRDFVGAAIDRSALRNHTDGKALHADSGPVDLSEAPITNWEKALHALTVLGGRATLAEIHAELVWECGKFDIENARKDLAMLSVNDKTRFSYGSWTAKNYQAKKQFDRVFFAGGIGKERVYEIYTPGKHKVWETFLNENGDLNVRQAVVEADAKDGWTDAELQATVLAYLRMAAEETAGQPYSKNTVYKDLSTRFGRSEKAFEYRMQNISAVLQELGRDWIAGLKPAGNVGPNIKQKIRVFLDDLDEKTVYERKVALYTPKLPLIRQWLIRVAKAKKTVTRRELLRAFGIEKSVLHHAIADLGHQSRYLNEPLLIALIIKTPPGLTSTKVWTRFGVEDAEAERNFVHEFWSKDETVVPTTPSNTAEPFEVKAAWFVSVEARPDQAAFRRRVFYAYQGRCVISGCDVVHALDAAHKQGRSWRLGHNQAKDGFVLRKDLHALYDCGLLTIGDDGTVAIGLLKSEHYQKYVGVKINVSCNYEDEG